MEGHRAKHPVADRKGLSAQLSAEPRSPFLAGLVENYVKIAAFLCLAEEPPVGGGALSLTSDAAALLVGSESQGHRRGGPVNPRVGETEVGSI